MKKKVYMRIYVLYNIYFVRCLRETQAFFEFGASPSEGAELPPQGGARGRGLIPVHIFISQLEPQSGLGFLGRKVLQNRPSLPPLGDHAGQGSGTFQSPAHVSTSSDRVLVR